MEKTVPAKRRARRARWAWMGAGVLACAGVIAGVALIAQQQAAARTPGSRPQNRITQENTQPGTDAWAAPITYAPAHLAAYAGTPSVNAGDAVAIYVQATGRTITGQLYRLGYYQNHGARLIATYTAIATTPQPACTRERATGLVSCPWTKTFTVATDPAWISGIFLLRLESNDGFQALTYFVVRNDGYAAPIVAQDASKTNQAYNTFGGESFYHSFNQEGRTRAYKVSYDRPYATGDGVGTLFTWETDMIRWLEASGYDVTYISDMDKATNAAILLKHRVFLDIGHDEYWSWSERDNVEAARAAGVNLVFASGNEAYWHVRLESSALGANHILVCYKDAKLDPQPAPPDVTVTFADPFLQRPENSLLGVQYMGNPGYGLPPWRVTAAANRWYFDCTGLQPGAEINNIVGYEWDTVRDNGHTPAGLEVIAAGTMTYRGIAYPAGTTIYTATSGAKVFAAGSIQWAWGLVDHAYPNYAFLGGPPSSAADTRIAQLTANILDNFTGAWDGRPRACDSSAQHFLAAGLQVTPTLVPPVPPPGAPATGTPRDAAAAGPPDTGETGEVGPVAAGAAPNPATPTPAPTPCATQVPLAESFAGGTLGPFGSGGRPGWSVVPQPIRAGTHSAFAPATTQVADQQLTLLHDVNIPARVTSATLRFVKRYQLISDETNNYMGAVLEISTDAGLSWTDAAPNFIVGGYTGTITACCGNPLAGRPAWVGVTLVHGTQTIVNLAPYAGHTVRVRWRAGSGGGSGGTGIWIDGIILTVGLRDCGPANPPPGVQPSPTRPSKRQ